MAGKGFTVKKDWDNPREHPMAGVTDGGFQPHFERGGG